MKFKIVIIVLLITCFFLKGNAQNLVPNGGFEIFDTCPYTTGQIYLANPWFQPNTYMGTSGSSDFYNECAAFGSASVPINTNVGGFQFPNNGSGYSGIIFRNNGAITSREYIETPLITPLVSNKKYCVEFYICLADTCSIAISSIGTYFSTDSLLYSSSVGANISVMPQVENSISNFISDKINWVLMSGDFIANGGEKFMTIGNFKDNISTPIQIVGTGYPFAYYYIDDVSVVCCDCEEPISDLFIPNAFSPNGDGANDRLRVLGTASKIDFKVFDRWGEIVYSYTGGEMPLGTGWDGTYKGKALDNAVFVYFANVVLPDGKEVKLKGNVSLIR